MKSKFLMATLYLAFACSMEIELSSYKRVPFLSSWQNNIFKTQILVQSSKYECATLCATQLKPVCHFYFEVNTLCLIIFLLIKFKF